MFMKSLTLKVNETIQQSDCPPTGLGGGEEEEAKRRRGGEEGRRRGAETP